MSFLLKFIEGIIPESKVEDYIKLGADLVFPTQLDRAAELDKKLKQAQSEQQGFEEPINEYFQNYEKLSNEFYINSLDKYIAEAYTKVDKLTPSLEIYKEEIKARICARLDARKRAQISLPLGQDESFVWEGQTSVSMEVAVDMILNLILTHKNEKGKQ